MSSRAILVLVSVMCAASSSGAQIDTHSSISGGEALREIRRNKLDLILPGAMRDNKVDMWIHVTRQGDPDPLALQFGSTYGYLVFTDLEMPKLNGLELTRAIRGRAASASLPVVIVTSLGSDDDRRAGVEAGANAYMIKRAFDQHALLDTVERLVGT